MHYYQHHIGDFIRDAGNLPNDCLGAYMRMLWKYYADETPLVGEIEDIAFDATTTPEIARQLLRRYFVQTPDGWRHRRCDEEIEKYRGKSEKARESANARYKNANALRTHCERTANASKKDANHKPITNNHKPVKNKEKHIRASRFDAQAHLESAGVPPKVAADWLKTRKQKRLPPTETALEGVKREAEKSGKTLAEVLTICCEKGWAGFQAAWLENLENDPRGLPRQRAGPPNVVHFNRQQALEDSNQRVLDEWLKQVGEESPGGVVIEGEFANEA